MGLDMGRGAVLRKAAALKQPFGDAVGPGPRPLPAAHTSSRGAAFGHRRGADISVFVAGSSSPARPGTPLAACGTPPPPPPRPPSRPKLPPGKPAVADLVGAALRLGVRGWLELSELRNEAHEGKGGTRAGGCFPGFAQG